jgi:hypothetical protein
MEVIAPAVPRFITVDNLVEEHFHAIRLVSACFNGVISKKQVWHRS